MGVTQLRIEVEECHAHYSQKWDKGLKDLHIACNNLGDRVDEYEGMKKAEKQMIQREPSTSDTTEDFDYNPKQGRVNTISPRTTVAKRTLMGNNKAFEQKVSTIKTQKLTRA